MDIRRLFLWAIVVFTFLVLQGVKGQRAVAEENDKSDEETELKMALVMFVHGERTPEKHEFSALPKLQIDESKFFPSGLGDLTNEGKQRLYKVGEYLRQRYSGFLSYYYLKNEIEVWSSDLDRTKMSALLAMAGLYNPLREQKWNPSLDWQPIPYNVIPFDEDSMRFMYNCPKHSNILSKIYKIDAIKKRLDEEKPLFNKLTQQSGSKMTLPSDVFLLNNLLEALSNTQTELPIWTFSLRGDIASMSSFHYMTSFYTDEAIKVTGGVILNEILEATKKFMNKNATNQPKLRVYSGHKCSLAALMSAARVFIPHEPIYGATFSLEFRKHKKTGKYGFEAVYKPDIFTPTQLIYIPGCGNKLFCEYENFVNLTSKLLMKREEYKHYCKQIQTPKPRN